MTEHLTNPHPKRFPKPIPGMASWSGWGPKGMTCRHCDNFLPDGHYSKNGHHAGAPKPGKCDKTRRYYGRDGESFPPNSAACNEFIEADKPFPARA